MTAEELHTAMMKLADTYVEAVKGANIDMSIALHELAKKGEKIPEPLVAGIVAAFQNRIIASQDEIEKAAAAAITSKEIAEGKYDAQVATAASILAATLALSANSIAGILK